VCVNASVREWRERNPGKVVGYYKPVVHEARECVECVPQFVPGRSDALVCSKRGRWRRDHRLRKAAAQPEPTSG
jgi:hypothetical protein